LVIRFLFDPFLIIRIVRHFPSAVSFLTDGFNFVNEVRPPLLWKLSRFRKAPTGCRSIPGSVIELPFSICANSSISQFFTDLSFFKPTDMGHCRLSDDVSDCSAGLHSRANRLIFSDSDGGQTVSGSGVDSPPHRDLRRVVLGGVTITRTELSSRGHICELASLDPGCQRARARPTRLRFGRSDSQNLMTHRI
jgi:hypothetical protein